MLSLVEDKYIPIDQVTSEKSIDELQNEFNEVKQEILLVKDNPKSSRYHLLFDKIHDLNNRIKIKSRRG
jgi:hypothetical protein